MSKINKIRLDGTDYDIERGMLPEVVQELPQTGSEDTMYLVPSENPGTQGETASGESFTIQNDLPYDTPIASFELLGDAEQTTYSGKQLYNYTNLRTTGAYLVVGDDGWYTFTADRTSESSGNYYSFSTYNLALDYSTSYAIVTEIASVSITGSANITPADRWGQFEAALFYNNPAVGTYVGTRTTKSEWGSTEGLASNVFVGAGSKATIKFRISVIADTSVTPSTFAYEPYVGGTASPNPDYPQAVNTVTGENTVEVVGKNLFRGDYDQFDSTGGTGTLYAYFELPTEADYRLTLVAKNEIPTQSTSRYIGFSSTGGGASGGHILWAYAGTAGSTAGQTRSFQNYVAGGGRLDYLSLYPKNQATLEWFMENFDIQLEVGSTATAFEPYQGQTLPVNLGKNLFSISQETIISNAYLDNNATLTFDDLNSVSITATGTQGAQYLYRIITGLDSTKNYTFSFKGTKNVKGSTGLSYIRITTYGSNDGNTWTNLGVSGENNPTQGETYSFTKTLTGYTQYRFMVFNNADTPVQVGEKTTYSEMMLELGSQATSYSAYFTPIELAKIGNYQDRIYKTNGKWYVEKQVGKVVYTGAQSESWAYVSGDHARFTISDSSVALSPSSTTVGAVMSDHFTPSTTDAIYTGADGKIAVHATIHQFWLSYFAITSVADFKTWLASHPTTVYYALATPTTTEITNSELVGQLEAILQAYLYTGTNNVSNNAVSPNLAGQMNIGYDAIDPQKKYDEYVWVEDDQEFELVGQAGLIQRMQNTMLTIKQGNTTLGTFSAGASENVEINTKNSYVIALGEYYRLNFNGTDIDDPAEASYLLSSAKAEEIKLADFPSAVCYYSQGGRLLNFIRATGERGEDRGPGAIIDAIGLNNDGTYDIWSGNIAFQGELVLQFLYMGDTFYPTGTWQLNNLNPILAFRTQGATPYDFLRGFLLSTQDAKGYVRAASYGTTGEGLLLGEAYYDTVGGEYVLVAELMSLRHQEIYSIAFKSDETYTVINRYKITTSVVPQ